MEKVIEKAVKPLVVNTFSEGCGEGFRVEIENITPAMVLGYTLVYIPQVTELMTLLGRIFTPVAGVFGLPGGVFAVLMSTFLTKASRCTTAATIYADGVLVLGQASMLLPACILIGTLIGHYARIVLVAGTNKKWYILLLTIPLFDTALSLIIMRMILTVIGIT